MTTRSSTVVGVFHSQDQARDAIQALKDSGFGPQDLSVLMSDRDRERDFAGETDTHTATGAATGAIGGGILGGLAGWLLGTGSLVIPGIGPIIAAGTIATALAGAGIGAGLGAITGALAGMGIPKEEAEWYEGEVRSGRTLVTVRADGRYDEARSILQRYGAYDIESRHMGAGTGGFDTVPATRTAGREEGMATGPDYSDHDHIFVNDRCTVCGKSRFEVERAA